VSGFARREVPHFIRDFVIDNLASSRVKRGTKFLEDIILGGNFMKKALIILADGFEEIEAVSTIDVLRRAGVEVIIAGLKRTILKGSHGISIKADIDLKDYKKIPDAVILPGGMPGATNLASSKRVISLVKGCFRKGRIVAAICASPAFVLFATGILKDRKVTCYPGCQRRFNQDISYIKKTVVIDGNLITSQGPGTALDFAFTIAEKLTGKKQTSLVKKKMLAK